MILILQFTGLYSKESAEHVQQLLQKNEVPANLFELYVEEIFSYLRGNIFKRFIESDKFTRKVSLKIPFKQIKDIHKGWNNKGILKKESVFNHTSTQNKFVTATF